MDIDLAKLSSTCFILGHGTRILDIFPQSLTVFLLSLSSDVDIHEEESIERIYYDERPLANNVIILTRSESGESGHLTNYSVNNGTSKKKLYNELGIESLCARRWMRKLSLFY